MLKRPCQRKRRIRPRARRVQIAQPNREDWCIIAACWTPANTARLAEQARAIGFDLCGVARAENHDEPGHLPEWLARGYAGEMRYLHDARRHTSRA